jgi:tetratricopeptide (TPR) repeat protein
MPTSTTQSTADPASSASPSLSASLSRDPSPGPGPGRPDRVVTMTDTPVAPAAPVAGPTPSMSAEEMKVWFAQVQQFLASASTGGGNADSNASTNATDNDGNYSSSESSSSHQNLQTDMAAKLLAMSKQIQPDQLVQSIATAPPSQPQALQQRPHQHQHHHSHPDLHVDTHFHPNSRPLVEMIDCMADTSATTSPPLSFSEHMNHSSHVQIGFGEEASMQHGGPLPRVSSSISVEPIPKSMNASSGSSTRAGAPVAPNSHTEILFTPRIVMTPRSECGDMFSPATSSAGYPSGSPSMSPLPGTHPLSHHPQHLPQSLSSTPRIRYSSSELMRMYEQRQHGAPIIPALHFMPTLDEVTTHVDLAIVYANPVVMRANGGFISVDALAQVREQRMLLDSLRESRRQLSVRIYAGTTDHFRVMLSNGCTVLHFSGHGIVDQNGCDMLVFEDADACAHFVDIPTLRDLLGPSVTGLKLVFLAACSSMALGRVFIDAGVDYVVCVRRSQRVMDKASIAFARAFYHALVSGKNVYASFRIGKARVASESGIPASESDKFVLLERQQHQDSTTDSTTQDDQPQRPIFNRLPHGKYRDMSLRPKFRALPAKAQMFIGRNYDIYSVLRLLRENRLVTVRGPPGMGKTSLVKALSHFALKRQQFDDGVVYCSLRGCNTIVGVFTSIATALTADPAASAQTGSKPTMADPRSTVINALRDANALLVWDNCEDILHVRGDAFRRTTQDIVDSCGGCSLVLASRLAVGGGLDIAEKVYSLEPLHPIDAARLFEHWCPRPITLSEIHEVVKSPRALTVGRQSSDSKTDDSTTAVTAAEVAHDKPDRKAAADSEAWDVDENLKKLALHPVLQFLGGHPQAISLAAPLLQDRTLSELQELLTTKSLDALQVENIRAEERSAVNTLTASLEVSMDHIRSMHGEDPVQFFCAMALVPSGALIPDLESIWGYGWRELMLILIRTSLVVRAQFRLHRRIVDKFYTFPFVTKYAEQLLTTEPSFAPLCCTLLKRCRSYFADVCTGLFDDMGTYTEESSIVYEKLQLYDLSLWKALAHWAPLDDQPVLKVNETISGIVEIKPVYHIITPVGRLATAFGSVLLLAARIPSALKAIDRGLKHVNRLFDTLGEANLRKVKAIVFMRKQSQYPRAKEELEKAFSLYVKAESILGQAITQHAMGVVLCKTQHFHEAMTRFERALTLFRRLRHKPAILLCYQWLATICSKVPGHEHNSMKYYDGIKRLQKHMKVREMHDAAKKLSATAPASTSTSTSASSSSSAAASAVSNRHTKGTNRGDVSQRWNGKDISLHLEIPTRYHDMRDEVKQKSSRFSASSILALSKSANQSQSQSSSAPISASAIVSEMNALALRRDDSKLGLDNDINMLRAELASSDETGVATPTSPSPDYHAPIVSALKLPKASVAEAQSVFNDTDAAMLVPFADIEDEGVRRTGGVLSSGRAHTAPEAVLNYALKNPTAIPMSARSNVSIVSLDDIAVGPHASLDTTTSSPAETKTATKLPSAIGRRRSNRRRSQVAFAVDTQFPPEKSKKSSSMNRRPRPDAIISTKSNVSDSASSSAASGVSRSRTTKSAPSSARRLFRSRSSSPVSSSSVSVTAGGGRSSGSSSNRNRRKSSSRPQTAGRTSSTRKSSSRPKSATSLSASASLIPSRHAKTRRPVSKLSKASPAKTKKAVRSAKRSAVSKRSAGRPSSPGLVGSPAPRSKTSTPSTPSPPRRRFSQTSKQSATTSPPTPTLNYTSTPTRPSRHRRHSSSITFGAKPGSKASSIPILSGSSGSHGGRESADSLHSMLLVPKVMTAEDMLDSNSSLDISPNVTPVMSREPSLQSNSSGIPESDSSSLNDIVDTPPDNSTTSAESKNVTSATAVGTTHVDVDVDVPLPLELGFNDPMAVLPAPLQVKSGSSSPNTEEAHDDDQEDESDH